MLPPDDGLELDFDRFIYETTETLAGDTLHIRVGCHHRNREPVNNVYTGETVAELCLDCDIQLPVIRGGW